MRRPCKTSTLVSAAEARTDDAVLYEMKRHYLRWMTFGVGGWEACTEEIGEMAETVVYKASTIFAQSLNIFTKFDDCIK
jgi:hypothetical protein